MARCSGQRRSAARQAHSSRAAGTGVDLSAPATGVTRPLISCAVIVLVLILPSGDDVPDTVFPAIESHMDSLIAQVYHAGGFTVDPREGSYPTTGYVVATGRATARIEPAAAFFDGEGADALRSYLRDKASALWANRALLIGAWYDRVGRRIVLSLVELVRDRAAAIKLGIFYHQRSIYDLAACLDIPTGYIGHP